MQEAKQKEDLLNSVISTKYSYLHTDTNVYVINKGWYIWCVIFLKTF